MSSPLAASLRTLWRSACVIALLLVGLLMALLVAFDFSGRLDRLRMAGWWHRRLLGILGLRVTVHGKPLSGAHLTVANHVSWLDIPLMGSVEPLRFVAKAEIRHWPIAGQLATACGSLYIRRGKGGARPMLDRIAVCLRQGGAVVLFPEGTTTDGRQVLPFHARLFGAAIEAHCPIQPVALRYHPGAGGRDVAPFIGDDDLLRHVLRVLREPGLRVDVFYCTPLATGGADRAALSVQAQAAVERALGLPVAPAAQTPPLAALAA
ncbi:lysophospholipid acyltransferase family protein [Solimonas soli]|uniref:lysophospholipid acyltransferase family protein n=1 Tax=Solimonas soli TaxID=413479 RepID=UPI0004AD6193|nr:lysophospholipid acyltransferase family protein [Solimonas soli]